MPSHHPAIHLSEPQKRILLHLRVGGPAPRSRLAEALGLGNGAMTRLSRELARLGLVEEQQGAVSDTGPAVATRGRPTVPLSISGEGGYAAGATAHPGWIDIVLVDFAGRPLVRDSIAFDSPDPQAFADIVGRRLRALAADPAIMPRRFLGFGIAVPGYKLAANGAVDGAVDGIARGDRRWVVDWLAGWRDIALSRFFDDKLGLPVWVENESTAAALAEYYDPAIIGRYRSILVFFLSHGVGAGLIAERDLFLGEYGNAGEIGRLFPGTGPRPSGIDLMRTLRAAGVSIDSLSALDGLIDTHASLIEGWMDRVAGQLRIALASGVAWLDPGAVVLSGSLPPMILQGLVARLNDWDVSGYRGAMPDLHVSPLGSSAVARGAAMVPIHAITAPTDPGQPPIYFHEKK